MAPVPGDSQETPVWHLDAARGPSTPVAVGTRISSRAPRTEPYVRLSRIRLVWDFLCHGCITPLLSCFVASFFVRPAPRAFFRPDRILPSPSRTVTVTDGACIGLSLSR